MTGLHLHRPESGQVSNYHYVVAEIDASRFGLSRDALVDLLFAENIWARRYVHPGGHRALPHLPQDGPPVSLPVTEAVCDRVLVLPAGAAIALEDVEAICAIINDIADNAAAIAARL